MRVRVISHAFMDLWRNRDMLNPLKSGFYAVELASHNLLRYSIPLFLTLAFFSSMILGANSMVFAVIHALHLPFTWLRFWPERWIPESHTSACLRYRFISS